ncbi:MAG: hypothetical protein AMXMBFR33_72020 [Candidatus Xenobia bacterium]
MLGVFCEPNFYKQLELRSTDFGQGVFTLEALSPGEEILCFGGPRGTMADMKDLEHSIQIGRNLFLGPSGRMDDYINHSCWPNCGIRLAGERLVLVAIEAIASGREVTFDYATCLGPEDDWVMRCGCRTGRCRGLISALSLPPETLERYRALDVLPFYIFPEAAR